MSHRPKRVNGKFSLSSLLKHQAISRNKSKNSTSIYSQTQKSKEKIIKTNIKYCEKVDLLVSDQEKTIPKMYWLGRMHKTTIGERLIVASKNYSFLIDTVSLVRFLKVPK